MNNDKELKELVGEILTTTDDYIENALPLVRSLGEDFYKEASRENWDELINLFDAIAWIIETITEIDSIKNLENVINEYETWNEYVYTVSQLKPLLEKLEIGLEEKNNALLGDTLIEEILPIFEDMLSKLKWLKN